MSFKSPLSWPGTHRFVKSGGKVLAHLLLFTLLSAILVPLTVLKVFDLIMPRDFFNIIVLVALVVIPMAVVHSGLLLLSPDKTTAPEKKQMSRRAKIVMMALIGLPVVAAFAMVSIRMSSDRSTLAQAKQHFAVDVAGVISQKRVDSTLIELERQFDRLKTAYKVSNIKVPIQVVLYPDVETLHAETASPDWGDAFITQQSGRAVIHLPAEAPPNDSMYQSAQQNTARPAHEIAHLIIHSKVGSNQRAALPLWFDEGVAQFESQRGFLNTNRVAGRLDLWLGNIYQPDLLRDSRFILNSNRYPGDGISAFYGASFEFVRYIASTHKGSLYGILDRLAAGESFASAFQAQTGESVSALYEEWRGSFFLPITK